MISVRFLLSTWLLTLLILSVCVKHSDRSDAIHSNIIDDVDVVRERKMRWVLFPSVLQGVQGCRPTARRGVTLHTDVLIDGFLYLSVCPRDDVLFGISL